ncbi:MAG TPA: T9SS type A sorting domain-containing protein [Bacteroidia bacterium]|jgi:hypothetical protein|nr:T9SS type A sorting domain-containing protein [Bacteroidia bacterium]
MKKSLLFVGLASLLSFTASAQTQVPNTGFENWYSDGIAPSTKQPTKNGMDGWWDFNMFNQALLGGSPVSVFEENTTVYSGAHSAKIVSVALDSTSYSYIQAYNYGIMDTMGLLVTANVNESFSGAAVKLGIPFTKRVTEFDFYYQYFPTATDTASCNIQMWHYSGGKRNVLGAGRFVTHGTQNSWTLAKVSIVYDSSITHNPDTIMIMLSAASIYRKPQVGNIFYVDSLNAFIAPAGIDELAKSSASVEVYPNPASSEVNFRVTASADAARGIQVYDITGKKIGTCPVTNNMATVNTSTYNSGLYFYQLFDKDGIQMNVGKFSVVK